MNDNPLLEALRELEQVLKESIKLAEDARYKLQLIIMEQYANN